MSSREGALQYFSVTNSCSCLIHSKIQEDGSIDSRNFFLGFLPTSSAGYEPVWIGLEKDLSGIQNQHFEIFYSVEEVAGFILERSEPAYSAFVKQFI
jgi:hypothetical protein